MSKITRLFILILFSLLTLPVFSEDIPEDVSVVYFSKEISAKSILKIYQKIKGNVKGEKIGIKVHFGEDGNQTFLNPQLIEPLTKQLNATLVETNVLYGGKRKTTDSHIKLAKEHGFTFAPIDILDSEGETTYKAKEKLKYFSEVKVGTHLDKYDTIIIYSHFKGHGSAGFGGAIKNVSMGFAPASGKLQMHTAFVPNYDPEKCIECGLCLLDCPENAISIKPVVVDTKKCIGCGSCISFCPAKVFTVPDKNERHSIFLEKLVEYAKVIQENKNMVYINVLANITAYCDCMKMTDKPFLPDIGILASTDIVAIEKASHDLVNKECKCDDAFLKENQVSGYRQIEYAAELKMGNIKYKLVDIDKD